MGKNVLQAAAKREVHWHEKDGCHKRYRPYNIKRRKTPKEDII